MSGNHLQAREYQRVYPLAAMALAQTVPKEPRLSTFRLLQSNSENGFNNQLNISLRYNICIYMYILVSVLLQDSPQKISCETGQDDGDSCWQGRVVNPT